MATTESIDRKRFTTEFDHAYTRYAGLYDLFVKVIPVWRNWIFQAISQIRGPRVLEVSFGTGYLLTRYAGRYETYGVDLNWKMVWFAKTNLDQKGVQARIQQGNVEHLPYREEIFDTVVNTMSFTGYPDGIVAMKEIHRVLKVGGRLVIIDINYPGDGNWLGMRLTRMWAFFGDIIRDMKTLLEQFGFEYTDEEIGGFGSVHLYVATKVSR
ncbi:MAG: methyltransferase domain-containing protein [Proteobacteria bacterium]|nr:methyltransferase domain-containing protein [Pseudomonadota bacterium]